MSISSEISRINGNIAGAYTAVSGKGGTLPTVRNSANLPTAIQSIPSGVTPSGKLNITDTSVKDVTNYAQAQVVDANLIAENIKKDVTILGKTGTYEGGGGSASGAGVKFIDYDGTLVDFWSASDVASKIALPVNPTGHSRLVAQGWNWSLANIKSYISSYPNADLWVGQMYKTASGFSEFDITLTKVVGKTVTFKMVGNKDWGDGTSDTLLEHTYTDYGDYTIKCDGTSIPAGEGAVGGLFGSSIVTGGVYCCTRGFIGESVTNISSRAFASCYSLTNVSIPNSVTSIGGYAFSYCMSLTSVTIPGGVTSIDNSVFNNCHSLASVTIPGGVTSIGGSTFIDCHSLASVTIPGGVTSIGNSAFNYCQPLTSVTIPGGVTSIGRSVFGGCVSLIKYDFSSATAVPTLANTSAFGSINGICKIVVPDALYDSWKSATNWSTYADYIYKASEVA